jgi:hypothetical protein
LVVFAVVLVGCAADDAGEAGTLPVASANASSSSSAGSALSTLPVSLPVVSDASAPTAAVTSSPSSSNVSEVIRLAAVELRAEDPSVGGQYVVVINPTDSSVDVTCWVVHSASTGLSARVIDASPLSSGASLRLVPDTHVFNSPDTITLLDSAGHEIDRTPQLVDQASDDQAWYRDATGAWTFGRQTNAPVDVGDGRLDVADGEC